MVWKCILGYLLFINIIAFALMGADKSRARRHAFRISERRLFVSALLGGSIGAIAGMYTFHHKTKHWYFVVGIPFILLLQIAAAVVLWRWLA